MGAGFRLSLGANYLGNGVTWFRVWAPDRRRVEVQLDSSGALVPLTRDPRGYYCGTAGARPGDRYRFRLDGAGAYPDPCSRWQPEGPHGPSEIVDPGRFPWADQAWRGLEPYGQVIYELHVGAFTTEGTYAAMAQRLPLLLELGVTCLELMPLATFPGRFNWGYDGVDLFAPFPGYGTPDDLRRLVDRAHGLGLGVILDVVYNHLGPEGNYLEQYAKAYFTDRHRAEWGKPVNFGGRDAGPVRDFFAQNAAYWISEFHFDGLRLDATQNLFDRPSWHIVGEVAATARAAASPRSVYLVGETEPQDIRLLTPLERGGDGLDAIWVDDFHHSARIAAGGAAEGYLQDYRGTAQELLWCALYGSLYQGQHYSWHRAPRGSPLIHADRRRVVFYLQNHDQIANSLLGFRLHALAGPGLARALTAFLLLLPQTPMLFMGQEHFASTPFFFFADHRGSLAEAVREGRREFLSQMESVRQSLDAGHGVPDGGEAFRRSVLDWSERDRPERAAAFELHRELLRLRREDPVLAAGGRLEGAALSDRALVLRWFSPGEQGDRLLALNLGSFLRYEPCPLPLLAPPPGRSWIPVLSTDDPRFGGQGAFFPQEQSWAFPGRCAILFSSRSPEP